MKSPMDPGPARDRLEQLLRRYFQLARAENQRRKLEPAGSQNKPEKQVPHPFDQVVDAICLDLGLPNPGTDGHSFRVFGHPVEGWPPDVEEQMRLGRVKLGLEKARPGDTYAPLFGEPYRLDKG